MTNLPALREAVAKIAPCPKCSGAGFLVTNSSHAEHDAGCDGSCRNCPVEVPDQDIGPCDCEFAQANLTEADLWRLASALPALLDEVEAERERAKAAEQNLLSEAEEIDGAIVALREAGETVEDPDDLATCIQRLAKKRVGLYEEARRLMDEGDRLRIDVEMATEEATIAGRLVLKLEADVEALHGIVAAERREREHTQQTRDKTLDNLAAAQANLAAARAVLDHATTVRDDLHAFVIVSLDRAAWLAWQGRQR